MKSMRPIWVLVLMLAAALACNAPSGAPVTPTSDITPFIIPTATGSLQPTMTTTPAASATPEPTATVSCIYNAHFLEDVTVPDGSNFAAEEIFEKTWRMENSGCLVWPEGTELVFLRGERMNAATTVPVEFTAVGARQDITVAMKAPATPGTYRGFWQLQAPGDLLFGPEVFVEIVVPEPTGSPDLFLAAFDYTPNPAITATVITFRATVKNQGDALAPASRMTVTFEGANTLTVDVPALQPGATYDSTLTAQWAGPGTFGYSLRLDTGGAVSEGNEDNNERVGTAQVWRLNQTTGTAQIALGTCYDLDKAAIDASCGAATDFIWEQQGANRFLTPKNGTLAILGANPTGYHICAAANLSTTQIIGTEGSGNQIPNGTNLCVKTSDGRYASILVVSYGANLGIAYTVWELKPN